MARKMEKDVSKGLKGRVQPGSGNTWAAPGDVKSKHFLVECKATTKKSFSINLKLLDEINKKALFEDKIAIVRLDISGRRLWVVEDHHVEINDENGEVRIA